QVVVLDTVVANVRQPSVLDEEAACPAAWPDPVADVVHADAVDGERTVLEHEARVVRTVHLGPGGVEAIRPDDPPAGPAVAGRRDRAQVDRVDVGRTGVARVGLRAVDEGRVARVDHRAGRERARVAGVGERPADHDAPPRREARARPAGARTADSPLRAPGTRTGPRPAA